MEKVADKRVGKPFSVTGKNWRVRCDLTFADARTALALRAILLKFETSAIRRDGNGVHSH